MTHAAAARSWLFAPGDSERKLDKALAGPAGIVIADLEDSVATPRKAAARAIVAERLRQPSRRSGLWVRVNPLEGASTLDDLVAVVAARPDGIVLPKAARAEAERLDAYLTALEAAAGLSTGGIPVLVIATETPRAIFALGQWPGAPRLAALSWGAEDSAAALGALSNREDHGAWSAPYQLFRALALTAAADAGVPAVETIWGDFRDGAGLARTAARARRDGFRGMLCIHPDQVEPVNAAFTPSEAEIHEAEAVAAAFAAEPDAGVVQLDGRMLDLPHLKRARATLALAGRG
ncbi:MAG: CoA ester lyase [Sphingomonadaceae bacterium]|nr:CoA ester lyase [Sphingomonadaceae bacterium]